MAAKTETAQNTPTTVSSSTAAPTTSPTTAVATNAPNALAAQDEMARPARIASGDRRGLENITKQDVLVPRLALAQLQSPEVTEGDPNMVEGMKAGDLFNSITKQNYGREVFVQIVRKDNLRAMEFVPVDEGGGVADPDVPLGDPRLAWGPDGEKPRATLFRDYIARILPGGSSPASSGGEMIALSFKSSGIKVAKTLNGLIALRNAPIFEGRYKITTDTELKPKPHKIYKVANAGWVSDEDSKTGADMWEAVKDLDIKKDVDQGPDPDDFPHGANVGEQVGDPGM